MKWIALLLLVVACAESKAEPAKPEPPVERKPLPKEKHFKKMWQLTFGGENAEAYWSFDEKQLIFQSTRPPFTADQIFTMNADGKNVRLVSTGKGRTTCAYFLPGDKRIVYASTHLGGDKPPTPPDMSRGYVWALFDTYDIFVADADGKNPTRLTKTPGYDAEATVSPTGDRIVFTSMRDGDIELYSMKIDGSDVKRLTNRPGYDGGAFFSWDGKKIVWRAPGKDDDLSKTDYSPLLKRGLVRPSKLEIWIMDADGSNKKQVTNNGKANFGPFWHPDNRRVIFSSNVDAPQGGNFELYLVDTETGKTERVTWFERRREGARRSDDFDGFPMFTRDGKRLVFCSNRHNDKPNETNV
ncbi:MAG: TolB family protein, partial [Planctomycetota bacterium]